MVKLLQKYLFITIGAILYAAAIAFFLDVNDLAPGGFSGIAIIFNRFFPYGTGTWYLILNIPVLFLGTWKFGIRFILSTLYSVACTSVLTNVLTENAAIFAVPDDRVMAVIAGSVLAGMGLGITFLTGATMGGSDIIVKILRLHFPHIGTGKIFFAMDAFIVVFAGIALSDIRVTLYSFVSVWLMGYVMDIVLYGRDGAKLIYIISDRPTEIAERLLTELDLGVTYIEGKGAYSGMDKQVIMCAMKKRISPQAEHIVREEDPEAFMIVTSANEIFGEGYKSYFDERI